ncbi:hypothetical protein WA538_003893 [Blastocystis sp. DL]
MISEVMKANWTELWSTFKTESRRTLLTFYKSIDWSETWIRCAVVVMVLWFVMILVFRNSFFFQFVAFIVDSSLVFGAKGLNSLGRKYWKHFSKTNYFDQDGFFISFFFSLPILLITTVQILFILYSIIRMSVDIRRFRILEKKHKELEEIQQQVARLERENHIKNE